jgi:hypothetical protein
VVARITQNSKALNAVYGLKAWSHKEIAEQGVEFLGLHFQLQRKYGRNKYGSFTVRPAKTREWQRWRFPPMRRHAGSSRRSSERWFYCNAPGRTPAWITTG